MTPELFAPGIVNTAAIELNGVISPDGRQFFLTRIVDDVFTMYRSVRGLQGWSDPEPVQPYAGGERADAVDMAYSADGYTLCFLGKGVIQTASGVSDGLDPWGMQRQGPGWSTARVVPQPVSTEHRESYPCVAGDGSLYFKFAPPRGVWRGGHLQGAAAPRRHLRRTGQPWSADQQE